MRKKWGIRLVEDITDFSPNNSKSQARQYSEQYLNFKHCIIITNNLVKGLYVFSTFAHYIYLNWEIYCFSILDVVSLWENERSHFELFDTMATVFSCDSSRNRYEIKQYNIRELFIIRPIECICVHALCLLLFKLLLGMRSGGGHCCSVTESIQVSFCFLHIFRGE